MRTKLASFIIALLLAFPAHAQFTKSAIISQINSQFPDQNTGAITPATTRAFLNNLVNSYQQYTSVNPQAGTTYTINVLDYGKLVTFNNNSSIAVSLPQAAGSFQVFNTTLSNLGAGLVTITPTGGSTINGQTSFTLSTGASVWIISDGTNYQTVLSSFYNNAILASSCGVKSDGVSDDSAAWTSCISKANANGNTAIIVPVGTSLAPTLADTITGNNVWIVCGAGPGSCIIKGATSVVLTWSGTGGGTFNMGFNNSGSGSALFNLITGSSISFYNSILGTGIGTFVQAGTGTVPGSNTTINGVQGSVSNSSAVPLFSLQGGNGLYIFNANVNPVSQGIAGRNFLSVSGTNALGVDTVWVANSFPELFDKGIVVSTVDSGAVVHDFFIWNNVFDTFGDSIIATNAIAGSFLGGFHVQNNWFSQLTTGGSACVAIAGSGDNFGWEIEGNRFSVCGKQGISATGTLNYVSIKNNFSYGISSSATNTYNGIDIPSGCTHVSIQGNLITNNTAVGQTTLPAVGLNVAGICDYLLVDSNDITGTTANYNGMLAGTSSTYAHTNTKQKGNLGLIDNPALTVPEGGTGISSLTTNGILSGGATVQVITPANSSVLVTSAGGVPSLSTTLPAGLTLGPVNPIWSSTSPSISSGFCSTGTPTSISANNGTAAFDIAIGSATCGSTGVILMPASTTGWVCHFNNVTSPANTPSQTGGVVTSVNVTNFARSNGTAINFTASDHVRTMCTAY